MYMLLTFILYGIRVVVALTAQSTLLQSQMFLICSPVAEMESFFTLYNTSNFVCVFRQNIPHYFLTCHILCCLTPPHWVRVKSVKLVSLEIETHI